MRKNIGTRNLILGSLALLLSYGAMQAKVVWHDTHTPNVDGTDPVLEIQSDSILTSQHDHHYVRITASHGPINVFLNQQTDPLQISRSEKVDTLFLEPTQGDIIFHVHHDMRFVGAAPEEGGKPLLIAVRGGKNVIFNIDGKKTIAFDPNGNKGGSVKFYVIMDGSVVQLNRATRNPESDIFINLGYRSSFGYASDKALSDEGVGSILFDPTNSGSGRMILQIENKASVFVSGRSIKNHAADSNSLVLQDIEKVSPAGCQAIFGIANSNPEASSRLLVLNSNKTLAHHQIWHPKTFLGKTYGFVLGCNGKLSIGTLCYLDYVGLSIDQCLKGSEKMPCGIEYLLDTSLCGNNCAYSPTDLCTIPSERLFKKRNPSALIVDGYDDPVDALLGYPACINLANQSAIVFRSGVDCKGVVENDSVTTYPFTGIPSGKRTPGAGNMVLDVEGCLTIAGTGTDPIVHPTKIEDLVAQCYTNGCNSS